MCHPFGPAHGTHRRPDLHAGTTRRPGPAALAAVGPAALAGIAAAAALACGGDVGRDTSPAKTPESAPRTNPPSERTWVEPGWSLLWRVGGTETDTLLYNPVYLAADTAGLYVYDAGRYAVVRFDLDGRLLWMYGHRGKDPDGFSVVRDIKVDGAGRAWILDPKNARITVLTPHGTVERRITGEQVALADKLAPLPDGRAVLFVIRRDRPLVFLDDGRPVGAADVPWRGFRDLSPLAGQMTLSGADAAGTFAVAFTLGDGFFVFRDTVPRPYHGAFIEHVPFPETVREEAGENVRVEQLPTRPVSSANSLWIAGGRVYVHFGGRAPFATRRSMSTRRRPDGTSTASGSRNRLTLWNG